MYAFLKIFSLGLQSVNSFINLQSSWINYFIRHNQAWQQFLVELPVVMDKETCHCKQKL